MPSPAVRLVIAAALALVLVTLFLVVDIRGPASFAIPRRLTLIGAMVVVACTQAVATVVFHTVTGNRILTPSIIGFDSMYVLMQTLTIFVFGGTVLQQTDGIVKLILQTAMMVAAATLLYRWLLGHRSGDLLTLLLVGVVLGLAFDAISTFLQRLLSPSEYDVLQLDLFGRMSTVDADQLPLAFGVCAVVCTIVWMRRHRLDVLLVGRDAATALGIDHRRELTILLILVSVLVAFSTALAGPMTFFGFVVAQLAYMVAGDWRHRTTVPMAFLLGLAMLAGGQLVLEHVFSANGFLTIIIESVGGVLFLTLLLTRKARL